MADIFKEAFELFCGLIGSGMYIMPPDNNFLFYEQYDFSNLAKHRDSPTLLIGQLEPPRPDGKKHISGYPCANNLEFTVDFGDSASKTGVLAFCNSETDQQHLSLFEGAGIMVRHPSQPPWNNWKNCTRDQLLAYSAGCWRVKRYDIVKRLLDQHYSRAIAGIPLCQNSERDCPGTEKPKLPVLNIPVNTDILDPAHIMFLRICSGDFAAYLDPIAQLWLQGQIETADRDIKEEKIPLFLQAIVCGRLDLLVEVHDNYKEHIRHYWNNTIDDGTAKRDQAQIGEALIRVIEQELKRYSGQLRPPTLGLPFETLKALFNINVNELFNGNLGELENYVSRIFTALGSDIQKAAKEIETYVSNALKNPLALLNVPFMPYNPVAKLINNLFNETDLSEVYYRLNEIQKGINDLKILSQKILDDVNAIPQKTLDKLYSDSVNFSLSNFKDYSDAYYTHLEKKGLQSARDQFKGNFISLAETINQDIYKFFSVEENKKYPFIPFVINCMKLHVSCITLSGQSPALIISIVKKYQNWLNNVVNDGSEVSLSKKIPDLQKTQKENKRFINNLYSLLFTVDTAEFTRIVIAPEIPPTLHLKGKVRKQTYELVKTIAKDKFDNLKRLDNIGQEDLPELTVPQIVEEEAIEVRGYAWPEIAPFVDINTKLAEGEMKINIRSTEIWDLCGKKLNVESPAFSPLLPQLKPISENILTCGESIINHALLMNEAKNALEQIDEIIIQCNNLLDG